MKNTTCMEKRDIQREIAEAMICTDEDLSPKAHPELMTFSPAFMYRFMVRPTEKRVPEYVFVNPSSVSIDKRRAETKLQVATAEWNLAWEAGHLRQEFFRDKLPKKLRWIARYSDRNIYLLPRFTYHNYDAYAPLFHLLPQLTLRRFGLPLLKRGHWPHTVHLWGGEKHVFKRDFDTRVSRALAYHVWPLLKGAAPISSISASEPIRVLAHNMDYWLPYVVMVAEQLGRSFDRVSIETDKETQLLHDAWKWMPSYATIDKPLRGGTLWRGEDEAWEATRQMVKFADSNGKLRAIIDAVNSHRVQDDFSDRWSFVKEDFERKLYHKRNKVKVTFVELDETIPVHGPDSEVHENLLWEDFIALLDQKERRIVICLRKGVTKVGDISRELGYANHSPISKSLARIREKARRYLSE